jgi:DNA-directed RNA polymerase specialized sigma24 family protein
MSTADDQDDLRGRTLEFILQLPQRRWDIPDRPAWMPPDVYDAITLAYGRSSPAELEKLLWCLPLHLRRVVLLKKAERLSTQEIAERLGQHPAEIEASLARARTLLRGVERRSIESDPHLHAALERIEAFLERGR